MKKILLKISSVLLALILLCVPLSISASAITEPNIVNLVVVENIDGGLVKCGKIDATAMNKIRNNVHSISAREKIVEIFKAIDVDVTTDNPIVIDLSQKIDTFDSMKSNTQILEISENGSERIISKNEYHRIEQQEQRQDLISLYSSDPDSNHSNKETSKNGYMELTLVTYFLRNQKGRYCAIGICKWLKAPLFRSVDAVSIGSDCVSWDQKEDSYVGVSLYTETETIGNSINTREVTNNLGIRGVDIKNGFFYTWKLPKDTVVSGTNNSLTYKNLRIMISGYANVRKYNIHEQWIDMKLRYSHIQGKISTDSTFSLLDVGSPDVFKISFSFSLAHKNYYCPLKWDYSTEF